ncbi:hypothetical protein CFU_2194 [Collimonas fungivorans Ter331]|uniref:Uncharacterized protein n=1 Tax=Collimonas fungivorans (strain Ter331) TaxID=1005048 RepID=G0AK95_COLFT|nr:hypothetical protein CFU_2194 [Collimonas fungivorans Ter331]
MDQGCCAAYCLLSVRNPDVLDLHRMAQKGRPFGHHRIVPVGSQSVVHQRPFQVARGQPFGGLRPGLGAECPYGVDIVMCSQRLQQAVAGAGDDIDHACRQVGGFQYLVKIGGYQWMALAGHDHHPVAHRKQRRQQADESQQRRFIRAHYADHADCLHHGQGHAAQRRHVHRALVFVGPCAVAEQALDGCLYLGLRRAGADAGGGSDACGEFGRAGRQVFGKVIQPLGAAVRRGVRPCGSGMRGSDRIADILAVAGADLAEQLSRGAEHGLRMLAVRPDLLAADVQLGGAVERGQARSAARLMCRRFYVRGVRGNTLATFSPGPRFKIFVAAFAAALASESRFAITAESDAGIEQVGRIHPDHARLQLRRNAQRQADGFAPDAGCQAVACVVGQRHGFVGRAKSHRGKHRPENFFGGHRGARMHVGEQRRRIKTAARRQVDSRLVAAGAFLDAQLHQCAHPFKLRRRYQRTDIDGLVQRLAGAQALHAALEARYEILGDAFLHQQARAGAADLALVEPDRIDHALDGGVDVGVLKYDERRFAAQLQCQRFSRSRGLFADQAPDLGRAGKRNLVHILVRDQRRTGGAVAGNHVKHAGRQPGLHRQLGKQQCAQRREFRRLEHYRIAQRQRGRDLPGQHQQGKIPGNDLADHSQRRLVGKFAFLQLRPAGVMVKMPRDQRHVDIARFADRLAVVERFYYCKQASVPLHHARQRIQVACPAVAAQGLPV